MFYAQWAPVPASARSYQALGLEDVRPSGVLLGSNAICMLPCRATALLDGVCMHVHVPAPGAAGSLAAVLGASCVCVCGHRNLSAGRCPLQVLREVLPDQGGEPVENSAALRAAARALLGREPQFEMKTAELGEVRTFVPSQWFSRRLLPSPESALWE